jgi:hypothetical protein
MPDNATYQSRKAAGICTRCGQRDAEPGYIACTPCATKLRHTVWAHYHRYAKGEQVTEADYAPRPYTPRRRHAEPAA